MAVAGLRRALEMAAVVLGLLALAAQPSTQESLRNPLRGVAHKINLEIPAFGIIATSRSAEKALNESRIFSATGHVDMLGRRFVLGTILGSNVVYVNSANRPSVHVGVTVQIMANNFNLRGIIHYGSAGGVDNSLTIGTVVCPGVIAHTGVWTWQPNHVLESTVRLADSERELMFSKYNYPTSENAQNLLGSVRFDDSEVYEDGTLEKGQFWLSVDEDWLRIASRIKEVETDDNCVSPANCLSAKAEVVVGLKDASSDIYVNNYAYREFLRRYLKASIVDTTSAAVALGAKTNGLKYIVFRGVANMAGASNEKNSALANKNAVKAVERFIFLATIPRSPYEK